MTKFTHALVLSGAALLVLGMATGAKADLTSGPFTSTTYTHATDFPGGASISLPQFNMPGTTLTQVYLTVYGSITSNIDVTAGPSGVSGGKTFTDVQFIVTDPGLNISLGPDPNTAKYSFALGPNGTASSGPLNGSGSDSGSSPYTSSSVLAEFTGAGSIVLPVSTDTTTNISYTSGNATTSQTTDASVYGVVTYSYIDGVAPTPEPGSVALFSTLIGSGMLLRRRRRTK